MPPDLSTVPATQEPLPVAPVTPARRWPRTLILAAALLVLGGAASAYHFRRGSDFAPTSAAEIPAAPEELRREYQHTSLLSTKNGLASILGQWQREGAVPPGSQKIIEDAEMVIRATLANDLLPADVLRVVDGEVRSAEFLERFEAAKSRPDEGNLTASVANTLSQMAERLKAQSDAYYMSQIKDLMKRSPLPLAERMDAASRYLDLHDPVISDYLAGWLRDIQDGDTGSVVVSDGDREKASQLLDRIQAEAAGTLDKVEQTVSLAGSDERGASLEVTVSPVVPLSDGTGGLK